MVTASPPGEDGVIYAEPGEMDEVAEGSEDDEMDAEEESERGGGGTRGVPRDRGGQAEEELHSKFTQGNLCEEPESDLKSPWPPSSRRRRQERTLGQYAGLAMSEEIHGLVPVETVNEYERYNRARI